MIQQKPKVLFVNFSERGSLDYGLILKKNEGFSYSDVGEEVELLVDFGKE